MSTKMKSVITGYKGRYGRAGDTGIERTKVQLINVVIVVTI